MSFGLQFLSNLVLNRTYAMTLPFGRKETWEETVNRCFDFLGRNYEDAFEVAWFRETFANVKKAVLDKHILPSMRLLQFAGEAVHREHARIYNCSGMVVSSAVDFGELCFLSMCGCGVGVSIPKNVIIPTDTSTEVFVIQDSKEGWADAFIHAVQHPYAKWDVSLVRPHGSPISTGGTASGSEDLLKSLSKVQAIAERNNGIHNPHDVADICCHILSCVLVGGTRRSAGIAIMDEEYAKTYKQGSDWQTDNSQRYLMNISMYSTDKPDDEYVNDLKEAMLTGEPGKVKYTKGNWLTNPCGEISGESKFFCNLTTINAPQVVKEDFIKYASYAVFLGTLQAGFTNFGYLRKEWSDNAKRDALIGVSITGIQQCYPELINELERLLDESEVIGTSRLHVVNNNTARVIGINPAKRLTCIKPEGTASALLGTSSGIHSLDSKYFIRHVMLEKTHPIIKYFESNPSFSKWIEPSCYSNALKVVKIPCAMEDVEIISPLTLVNRAIEVAIKWIDYHHIEGDYTNSVSLTISIPEGYEEIDDTLTLSRELGNVTVLKSSTETYPQAPFQWITASQYTELSSAFAVDLESFDWNKVNYRGRSDDRKQTVACSAGSCQIL